MTLLNGYIEGRGWPERFSLDNYLVCLFDNALRICCLSILVTPKPSKSVFYARFRRNENPF